MLPLTTPSGEGRCGGIASSLQRFKCHIWYHQSVVIVPDIVGSIPERNNDTTAIHTEICSTIFVHASVLNPTTKESTHLTCSCTLALGIYCRGRVKYRVINVSIFVRKKA